MLLLLCNLEHRYLEHRNLFVAIMTDQRRAKMGSPWSTSPNKVREVPLSLLLQGNFRGSRLDSTLLGNCPHLPPRLPGSCWVFKVYNYLRGPLLRARVLFLVVLTAVLDLLLLKYLEDTAVSAGKKLNRTRSSSFFMKTRATQRLFRYLFAWSV